MTADPIPPLITMWADIDAPVSVHFTDQPIPRIRLELVGGVDEINQIHDQALVKATVFGDSYAAADAMARACRAALTPGKYGTTVVTKATSTPPRYEDIDDYTAPCGAVSFTARVWLNSQP